MKLMLGGIRVFDKQHGSNEVLGKTTRDYWIFSLSWSYWMYILMPNITTNNNSIWTNKFKSI